MRESFLMYKSFCNAAKELEPLDRLELYEAVCDYALNDNEPLQLSGVVKGMFELIKPQIDANNRRYENGCKGGAPKGNQNARKKPKNKTEKQPKNNRKTTEKQPNDNDNDNDNVNDNDNDNELGCLNKSNNRQTTANNQAADSETITYEMLIEQGIIEE